MSQRLNNLNEIIAVLKSGSQFYRDGARKSGKAEHEKMFLEHAELRENVAAELSNIIEEVGGEVKTTSSRETLNSIKTTMVGLVDDKERALINGLEEHEDRTLAVFRDAIHHKDNSRDEPMLRDYMSKFEASHARMRQLQESA